MQLTRRHEVNPLPCLVAVHLHLGDGVELLPKRLLTAASGGAIGGLESKDTLDYFEELGDGRFPRKRKLKIDLLAVNLGAD
jgi:hypothetical protein